MTPKRVKITEIKVNPSNPRTIKDEKFKKLVKSIQDFPEMSEIRPIVVNRDMVILGGNMRFKAMKEAGWKDVPVIVADNLTPEQEREFLIKDNTSGGEWDWELIAQDWDASQLEEWGMELPEDLDAKELEAEEDDFEVPEGGIETDIVLGDLFEIGEHRLLCGDSTDSDQVGKLMNGEKADMVFTDPDYSMKEEDLLSCYKNELLIKADVSFWVCGDKQAILLASNDKDRFTHFFVHDFKVPTLISNTQPMQKHNLICKFGNKKMNNTKDGFSTIVSIATERTLESHKITRMAKRVELPAKFIEHYSNELQIVFDFFGHSGSTMVASHQLKRRCYMQELDPKYCQVIIDRMIKLDPSLKITKNGQPYGKS
jgi:DNA modification methylase